MSKANSRLQVLQVSGYKVLKDFALDDIGLLNVVVGPNGCGKSALFEVVTLVGEMARGLLPYDLDGSLHSYFYPRRSQQGFAGVIHAEIHCIEIELEIKRGSHVYKYVLRLDLDRGDPGGSGCNTVREVLIRDKDEKLLTFHGKLDYVAKRRSSPKLYTAVINRKRTQVRWPHRHPLLLANAPNDELSADPLFRNLRKYFASWRGFKPHFTYLLGKRSQDSRLLSLGEKFPGEQLDQSMDNLLQVLFRLNKEQNAIYKDIQEIFLATIVPGQAWNLSVQDNNNQVFVSLYGQSWPGGQYWMADWPDGWKAFLNWLVALRTAPPGGLIFIEEPENNLHPRLLAQLLEQIDLANDKGVQVFLSTHSMELVNMIEADELVLMDNGQAHRLDPKKADKIKEAGILLGSAWVSGFLEDIEQTPSVEQR